MTDYVFHPLLPQVPSHFFQFTTAGAAENLQLRLIGRQYVQALKELGGYLVRGAGLRMALTPFARHSLSTYSTVSKGISICSRQ